MRGYPSKLVIPSLHRVNKLTQREAISCSRNNTENSDNSIFCILDFNPTNPDVEFWIKKLWQINSVQKLRDMGFNQ